MNKALQNLMLVTAIVLIAGIGLMMAGGPGIAATASAGEKGETLFVRLANADGTPTEPILTSKFRLTDAEWQERLDPEAYRILRNHGTEPAFCGVLLKNDEDGIYSCGGCGLPIFHTDAKYDSGTGWPSWYQPFAAENLIERIDRRYGMVRTEIACARCEGHLGHVFPDGPAPSNRRYCINGNALEFTPFEELRQMSEQANVPRLKDAVFAGGCFWCVEAVFLEVDGVVEVINGYAGGTEETANYEAVVTGRTGHAESVRIVYDPAKVNYERLLEIHFATHNPTTLNRQGNDIGPQYRSAIFYADDDQKQMAERMIQSINDSGAHTQPVVTTLEPLEKFFQAEDYHQNYAARNPNNPYIRGVAMPKVEKVRTLLERLDD